MSKKHNTMAIDVVTIFKALLELETTTLGPDRIWKGYYPEQKYVLDLYHEHKEEIKKLKNLTALASPDLGKLNRFIHDHGLSQEIPGPLEGIGVVSILDMLVRWKHLATKVTISGHDEKDHVGFEIGQNGRFAYNINDQHVAGLQTKSGEVLWLTMPKHKPTNAFELMQTAFGTAKTIATTRQISDYFVTTVQVPEIDFELTPDIGFIKGADTVDENDIPFVLQKLTQSFKLRINKEGAHAVVVTAMDGMYGALNEREPAPLIFNRPFIGWFTQPDAKMLPIAIFYADYNSWNESEGLDF